MYLLNGRDWTGVPHLLAGFLLISLAVALLCVTVGDGSPSRLAPMPAIPADAGERPRIDVRSEPLGAPFEVAGAAFEVASDPDISWAAAVRRRSPGAGMRWAILAVRVGNLARRGFDPSLLSYLLRGPGHRLLAPRQAGVVGPNALGTAGGLPIGAAAEERLVFAVPKRAEGLALAIQPSPARALEVRVPLDGR